MGGNENPRPPLDKPELGGPELNTSQPGGSGLNEPESTRVDLYKSSKSQPLLESETFPSTGTFPADGWVGAGGRWPRPAVRGTGPSVSWSRCWSR